MNRANKIVKFLLFVFLFLSPFISKAASFSDTVTGRVLLDTQNNGEAWYVSPANFQRYFLGRPDDAFRIMSDLGLGITDSTLSRIPTENRSDVGDTILRARLSGRILLQVEQHGEAWYVYPGNTKRYFLGRPGDAFRIMSNLGLGITSVNLAKIPIAPSSLALPTTNTYSYRFFTLTNTQGSFPTKVITLKKDAYEMVTATTENSDCKSNCLALPLQTYVEQNNGFAGIHGTYFCPPDYPECAGKINTFLPPVFNTKSNLMINESSLKFHVRPFIAYTADGAYLYFHRTNAFGNTVTQFEKNTTKNVLGAIGNWPSLVENGISVVSGETQEPTFASRRTRGGIGWNNDDIFLVVTGNATVDEFSSVFLSLGATFAMNLDGGGSAALFLNGKYLTGPGRALPNAIIFRKK
ncbi:MAG: phosphodiester glycosidase family protein [Patescibacteria group bacterium]|jgi:hypothetical protein